jgi:hypothetical protein
MSAFREVVELRRLVGGITVKSRTTVPQSGKVRLPKITGQFNESLSATPPPDVFWRVRSFTLFQLDFPLQSEKSRFRDNAGGEAVF